MYNGEGHIKGFEGGLEVCWWLSGEIVVIETRGSSSNSADASSPFCSVKILGLTKIE